MRALAHLSKAITLIESSNATHKVQAQELLQELLPHTGNSIRIGITGVPGAGKSSFIEAFGTMLCDMGNELLFLPLIQVLLYREEVYLGIKRVWRSSLRSLVHLCVHRHRQVP